MISTAIKNKNLILVISIMAMLTACLSDSPKDLTQINNVCDTTYAYNVIKPIITKNCIKSGCHVTGASQGDWNDFSAFKARINSGDVKDRINRTPGAQGYMPNDQVVLQTSDLKKINDWIDAGAYGCW